MSLLRALCLVLTIYAAVGAATYFTAAEARRRRENTMPDRMPLLYMLELVSVTVERADPRESCVELDFWRDPKGSTEPAEDPAWTALTQLPHWKEAVEHELEALGYSATVYERGCASMHMGCEDMQCSIVTTMKCRGPAIKVCW